MSLAMTLAFAAALQGIAAFIDVFYATTRTQDRLRDHLIEIFCFVDENSSWRLVGRGIRAAMGQGSGGYWTRTGKAVALQAAAIGLVSLMLLFDLLTGGRRWNLDSFLDGALGMGLWISASIAGTALLLVPAGFVLERGWTQMTSGRWLAGIPQVVLAVAVILPTALIGVMTPLLLALVLSIVVFAIYALARSILRRLLADASDPKRSPFSYLAAFANVVILAGQVVKEIVS